MGSGSMLNPSMVEVRHGYMLQINIQREGGWVFNHTQNHIQTAEERTRHQLLLLLWGLLCSEQEGRLGHSILQMTTHPEHLAL